MMGDLFRHNPLGFICLAVWVGGLLVLEVLALLGV